MIEPTFWRRGLVQGCYKLPKNVTVIGDYGVQDTVTGNFGLLICHENTGIYSIFSCGRLCSVDQKEAARYATEYQENLSSELGAESQDYNVEEDMEL